MATEFFAQSPVLALPILALLIFSIVFVAIVIRTLRMAEDDVAIDARLPLSEDEHV